MAAADTDAAARARARAEARRQKILAGAGERLASIEPGAEVSPEVKRAQEAKAEVKQEVSHREDLTANCKTATSPAQAAAAADDAWERRLRARRRERGFRFFGQALLAAAFGGIWGGNPPCPPLLAFLSLELAVLGSSLLVATGTATDQRSAGGEDPFEAMISAMIPGAAGRLSARSLEWLDRGMLLWAAVVKVVQDMAWFLCVFLVAYWMRTCIISNLSPPSFVGRMA
eukprot:gnl/TRDRNA2_/TRDRNA2_39121_c0_seq1.p1 gnl/TRDRNA2_/TRDRNA2_39121_c0~~gnl/TRDRNA2_/TRDRNA2_39121_c0_seq1.p1  ORF type:complete len:229 (+),score=47.09 gnl/TRDRNA2_/TRDRNA2_39121_c0_seq1:24-710(+)